MATLIDELRELRYGEDVEIEIEQITPDTASDMLETGYAVNNRNVRPHVVKRYARDMADGAWKLTGESIKFDKQGQLLDGQHRLWAVIESGVTIHTVVVRGIDSDAFAAMDTGAKRTAGDLLGMHGYTDTRHLSATVNYVWAYREHGEFRRLAGPHRPRNDQVVEMVEAEPGIADWLSTARRGGLKLLGLSASMMAAMLYEFSRVDAAATDEFVAMLETGAGLDAGHPVLALRNVLIRMASTTGTRPDPRHQSALVIKGWNFWREGRQVKLLNWRPGSGEAYPEIA